MHLLQTYSASSPKELKIQVVYDEGEARNVAMEGCIGGLNIAMQSTMAMLTLLDETAAAIQAASNAWPESELKAFVGRYTMIDAQYEAVCGFFRHIKTAPVMDEITHYQGLYEESLNINKLVLSCVYLSEYAYNVLSNVRSYLNTAPDQINAEFMDALSSDVEITYSEAFHWPQLFPIRHRILESIQTILVSLMSEVKRRMSTESGAQIAQLYKTLQVKTMPKLIDMKRADLEMILMLRAKDRKKVVERMGQHLSEIQGQFEVLRMLVVQPLLDEAHSAQLDLGAVFSEGKQTELAKGLKLLSLYEDKKEPIASRFSKFNAYLFTLECLVQDLVECAASRVIELKVVQAPVRKPNSSSFSFETNGVEETRPDIKAAMSLLDELDILTTKLLAFCQTIFDQPEAFNTILALRNSLEADTAMFKEMMVLQLRLQRWMIDHKDAFKDVDVTYSGDYTQYLTLIELLEHNKFFSKFVLGLARQLWSLINDELTVDSQFMLLTKLKTHELKMLHSPMMLPIRSHLMMTFYLFLNGSRLFKPAKGGHPENMAFLGLSLQPLCTDMLFFDVAALDLISRDQRAAVLKNKYINLKKLIERVSDMRFISHVSMGARNELSQLEKAPLHLVYDQDKRVNIPSLYRLFRVQIDENCSAQNLKELINGYFDQFEAMLNSIGNNIPVVNPVVNHDASLAGSSVSDVPDRTSDAEIASDEDEQNEAYNQKVFEMISRISPVLALCDELCENYDIYEKGSGNTIKAQFKKYINTFNERLIEAVDALNALDNDIYEGIPFYPTTAEDNHTLQEMKVWCTTFSNTILAINRRLGSPKQVVAEGVGFTGLPEDIQFSKKLLHTFVLLSSWAAKLLVNPVIEQQHVAYWSSAFKDLVLALKFYYSNKDRLPELVASELPNAFVDALFAVIDRIGPQCFDLDASIAYITAICDTLKTYKSEAAEAAAVDLYNLETLTENVEVFKATILEYLKVLLLLGVDMHYLLEEFEGLLESLHHEKEIELRQQSMINAKRPVKRSAKKNGAKATGRNKKSGKKQKAGKSQPKPLSKAEIQAQKAEARREQLEALSRAAEESRKKRAEEEARDALLEKEEAEIRAQEARDEALTHKVIQYSAEHDIVKTSTEVPEPQAIESEIPEGVSEESENPVAASDESERSTTPPAVIASERSERGNPATEEGDDEVLSDWENHEFAQDYMAVPHSDTAASEEMFASADSADENSETPSPKSVSDESENPVAASDESENPVAASDESERSTTPPAVIASERSERGNPDQTKTFSKDWATTTDEIQSKLAKECIEIDNNVAYTDIGVSEAYQAYCHTHAAIAQLDESIPEWAQALNAVVEAEEAKEKAAIRSEMEETLNQFAYHQHMMHAAYMNLHGLTQKMQQLQQRYYAQLPADMQVRPEDNGYSGDGVLNPSQDAAKVPLMRTPPGLGYPTFAAVPKQAPKVQNLFKTGTKGNTVPPKRAPNSKTPAVPGQAPKEILKRPAKS